MSGFSFAAQMKQTAMELAPSLWVRWHLMRRPRSAEIELSLLKRIVRPGDITVDVGANVGLYTRTLAHLSSTVHAFEPSSTTADTLRRTSARNVIVHEIALSDCDGQAELHIPRDGTHLTYGLGSIEPDVVGEHEDAKVETVQRKRLDSVISDGVSFVKIDVEGHELSVLRGASGLIKRCRPVFLVEAENRHRAGATDSLFQFFRDANYEGYFLRDRKVCGIDTFAPNRDQDQGALLNDGSRVKGRYYINNFFFFPAERDGRKSLSES
jgi:FkbM family methyltransferase